MSSVVAKKKLQFLMVGGGHAHLDILHRLALHPQPGLRVTLASWFPRHHYSGMVPGYLTETYSEEEISFDLNSLCARSGSRFVCGKVEKVDSRNRRVHMADGDILVYDLLSFNVGSGTLGGDRPDVRQHARQVKPMSRVVQLKQEVGQLLERTSGSPPFLNVVGGGAAGFEVACALSAFLLRNGIRADSALIDGGPEILRGYPRRFRRRAVKVLQQHRVQVKTSCRVEQVTANTVVFETGETRGSDLTVWLTGPAAPALFLESGLKLSENGFLLVDDSLRSVSDPTVFAVGDCATIDRYPDAPKAGVYAVRHAPVLWETLMWAVSGTTLPHYVPQRGFLSILNTSDGKALLLYKGMSWHGRWAWHLKNWIDQRFARRYQGPLG